jgi:hypothetical protein
MENKISKEIKLMDMLDDSVSSFFSLEGTTDEDRKKFVKHIRECEKILALVCIRNMDL